MKFYSLVGSMPPHSHSIFDEGAVFMSFKLVEKGIFQEEGNHLIYECLEAAIPLFSWNSLSTIYLIMTCSLCDWLAVKVKLLEPAKYPGCSGSRNLQDNISDLKAQVAANHKVRGICLSFDPLST